ncbi:hypothetical protein KCG44_01165 [Pacificimonas sp. WHA3]|uniref:Lipoprotein n=1 Tax=Pacificimonas pallii TaxID=2827236 RepID=A0ABS6SBU0_9SPHN|nr:hypothetical protein [Pacificimonas pallii]MBV7255386.1 hypothetical protein [Pacificimonas pallii]
MAVAAGMLIPACAPLRSEPLIVGSDSRYGRVIEAERTEIKSGESRAERSAMAALSLNPVVAAVAMLGVEDDFGRAHINDYKVLLTTGTQIETRSRYIVKVGECVMIRSAGEGRSIIIRQPGDSCLPAAISGSTPKPWHTGDNPC